jgi:hypothetical protein
MIATYTDKYMDMMVNFMFYLNSNGKEQVIPNKSNLIFFDANDGDFSQKSLKIMKNQMKIKKDVVEITKTGDKDCPWKISQAICY